jgi:uncharacterized oxidoreductase
VSVGTVTQAAAYHELGYTFLSASSDTDLRGVAHGAVTIVALGTRVQPYPVAAGPGAEPALQTNPIAVGVPAGGAPLLLDMATSAVAEGKIALALAQGTAVREGTLVDASGRSTTDPADLYAGGALLPAGGYKGFGLGAIVEALAICFAGADARGLSPDDGALVVWLRADLFRPLDELNESVDKSRVRLRASGRTSSDDTSPIARASMSDASSSPVSAGT